MSFPSTLPGPAVSPGSPFYRFSNSLNVSPPVNPALPSSLSGPALGKVIDPASPAVSRDIYSRAASLHAPTPEQIKDNPAAQAEKAVEGQVIASIVQGKNALDPTLH
jgi:hypothetical protein